MHEHAHGPDTHTHDDTFDVLPEEHATTKVRFVFPDGSYITVHVRDGELRACGSRVLVSHNHRPDVVAVNATTLWQEG